MDESAYGSDVRAGRREGLAEVSHVRAQLGPDPFAAPSGRDLASWPREKQELVA
jgi:hypothetical protein